MTSGTERHGQEPAPVDDSQSFDGIVPVYERFGEIINAGLAAHLLEELPGGIRAIDVGCGGGHLTSVLAQRYDSVLGVDLSPQMVDHARARSQCDNATFVCGDLMELNRRDTGLFDLVFSAYTLHHVSDLRAALSVLASLVEPGGQLVLVDIVGRREHLSRNWYARQGLKTLLGDLFRFRRPVREAFELHSISRHPDWLRHTMSDRPVSAEEFESTVGSVLPDATILDLKRARMVQWTSR